MTTTPPASKRLRVSVGDQSWELDLNALTLADAFIIKSACGLGIQPFLEGVQAVDPDCIQTLVWYLRRRDGETGLHREAVAFRLSDLRVDELDEGRPTTSAPETPAADATDTSTT